MKVLSLFDGLSGAQVALQKLGVAPQYFASEIDEYAIKITMKNFPNTIQLGDVKNWQNWELPQIDLLIGGSPCQGLSVANNKGKGLADERSNLFWQYVDILNAKNPRYFVLENVESMKTKDFVIMTNALGVEPIMLDAGLVSAQRRKRYFWTNIPGIKRPADKGLVIADILEPNAKRRELKFEKERIVKTSYGVRWNAGSNGIQSQKAISVNSKGCVIDASLGRKYPYRIVSGSSQPQGMSAQWTTEKDFSVVASNPQTKALIVDHNSQQNRAFNYDTKHGVLAASRTTSKTTFVFDDLRIEQLTWTELERLAGLPQCDIITALWENIMQKNLVNITYHERQKCKTNVSAETQNGNVRRSVFNVENDKLKLTVECVGNSFSQNNLKIENIAHTGAALTIQNETNQSKKPIALTLNAKSVELKKKSLYLESEGKGRIFALLNAFTNLTEVKITLPGSVVLVLRDRNLLAQKNGERLFNQFGQETRNPVENVIYTNQNQSEHFIYTTLSPLLLLEKIGQILTIWSCYANDVTFGFTLKQILTDNFWICPKTNSEIKPIGYTDLGAENKTEGRGRAIGNGFQIDIVAHLLSYMLSNPAPKERAQGRIKAEQFSLFDEVNNATNL